MALRNYLTESKNPEEILRKHYIIKYCKPFKTYFDIGFYEPVLLKDIRKFLDLKTQKLSDTEIRVYLEEAK